LTMEWVMENWQTVAVGLIVGATVGFFARNAARKKKPGCKGKCGCGKR
jgi:uncharacterized membrane-anchored protein YhcB (DUF1043 family)